ncbi:MAG: hypothetical protein HON53_00165 [Planctomycetaceae bacterium]|jgi:hypothetical protein|nr:hypothetical protein [Planctomycetaceae bacterium]MBT6156496.1 hypothetical protein [Planctomycetaceae bacterium]MBT6485426.1 hypothetical protein [Planctomycetaceae bacterium]MBT6497222.1 hypothetical protein [Planctomycetaceae bacterium]
MSANKSPFDFVKRNGIAMLVGMFVCGLVGYFTAGADGRALGTGIGVILGLIASGLAAKVRGSKL